jgi:hypothetical protein
VATTAPSEAETALKMKTQNHPATTPVRTQVRTRVPAAVPAPAAVLVIIVVLLTTALTVLGTTVQSAVTTVGTAGLLGIELVRRLALALTSRRAR